MRPVGPNGEPGSSGPATSVLLRPLRLVTLLGYLTGGIGQLVADYFMIQNLNKTALVYNSRAY